MDSLITGMLALISMLLTINIFVLKGIGKRLDKITTDVDEVWKIIRTNTTKIAVIETKMENEHGK